MDQLLGLVIALAVELCLLAHLTVSALSTSLTTVLTCQP